MFICIMEVEILMFVDIAMIDNCDSIIDEIDCNFYMYVVKVVLDVIK